MKILQRGGLARALSGGGSVKLVSESKEAQNDVKETEPTSSFAPQGY
jgi:hypothetical protein